MGQPTPGSGLQDTPGSVHFIAIGGTGMGSLAGLLNARGVRVSGSDRVLYPPMSTALEAWGIPVSIGFDPAHVRDPAPDLVVIGNAVRADNPEARAALDAGLSCKSFPDALYDLAIAGRHPVVVSGTHGKTTTTSLVAYLLHATGRDPSLLVGGISLDFDGSFREGRGEYFVVEGDEYDTAFFDKTPKFLHYHPQTLVLTSIEFDHADIYRDLEHVKSAFRELVATMPRDGTIVAAWDSATVQEVVRDAPCRVVSYDASGEETADWSLRALEPESRATRLEVSRFGGACEVLRMPLFARFNAANTLAALAVLESLGVPFSESAAVLPDFRGVRRRQEIRGEIGGVTVVDDFAHHPTAVRASIEAMRARFPGRRLLAIFEPRTNTSRRQIFQEDYALSLAAADQVLLLRVPDDPIYSATGEVGELLSVDRLVSEIQAAGTTAQAFGQVEDIVSYVGHARRSGDVLLAMSNGAFGGIWGRLLEVLREQAG